MIIDEGPRKASFQSDEGKAAFPVHMVHRGSIEAHPGHGKAQPSRCVVELLLVVSGLWPRALIGGSFVPGLGSKVIVEVHSSGPMIKDAPLACPSQISDAPYVPGLPTEFAESVLRHLTESAQMPAGKIVIDRGAYDPVGSAQGVFGLASELFAVALRSSAYGRDPGPRVRAAIRRWA